ncbi:MAG: carbon-nitrogen hydrolase family protein [Elusimicrobiota bacterium]
MKRLPLYIQPVPLDLAWGDVAENLRRVEAAVRRGLAAAPAVPSQSRIFLFPELTLTAFVTKDPPGFRLKPMDAEIAALCAIARRQRTALAAGFPERNPRRPGRPFNTAVLIDPSGKMKASYRKTHLFTLGSQPETASYSAGEGGLVFDYRGWRIAFAVCFDIRFPRFFHAYARAGADLILVPACWVGGPHKSHQFKTVNSAHAVLTQAYVAAVNRSGKDPAYAYDGSAYVFSPFGEDVLRGGSCVLDPKELELCRSLKVRPSDRPSYPIRVVRPA